MKRNIYVLGAAALVMLAACQKEEVAKSNVALTATLEQQTDNGATKTALGESNTVVWSEGDKIKVHGSNGEEELTLTSGAGTTTGSFGTPAVESPDYAIYPSSAYTSIDGSTFTFTLPATQTYAAGSFGNGANVAVARIEGSNMTFKNVCGALKLQLKGSMKVKTIELTGKNGEKLSGAFTVDVNANPFVGAVKSGEPGDAEKKVTLDCSAFGETSAGAADGGVQLDSETPTVFNIIVPVSAFAGGFDAKITDVAGATFFTTLSTTSDNTIERSVIVAMPSKVVCLTLPVGYTALEYIESTGKQCIDTGVPGSKTTYYSACLTLKALSSESMAVIGSNYDSGTQQADRIMVSPSYKKFYYQGSTPVIRHDEILVQNKRYNVEKNTKFWVNGNSYSYDLTAASSTARICVLACIKPSLKEYEYFTKAKLYCAAVYNGSGYIRKLVPVKRNSDNNIGMFDLINSKFYANAGTDDFIAGPSLAD